MAAALKSLLIELFSVAATNFYDDFNVIEIEALIASTRVTVERFFALLGWRLKELSDFSEESSPLGAVLDLSRCREGISVIKNKPSRVQEIVATIDAASTAETIPAELLPRLRGRLLFARSLSFGRSGGAALRAISQALQTGGRAIKTAGPLAQALGHLREHLLRARPREIRLVHGLPPLIFIDGSFDTGDDGKPRGGIGGIILDPKDMIYESFSLALAPAQVSFLLGVAGVTAIFQLEILPALVARRLWSARCRGRSLIIFCDNESAKSALIAGFTQQPVAVRLLSLLADLDVIDGALPWFERVPTASNPADAPSRCLPSPLLPPFLPPVSIDAQKVTDEIIQSVRGDMLKVYEDTELDPRHFAPGVSEG